MIVNMVGIFLVLLVSIDALITPSAAADEVTSLPNYGKLLSKNYAGYLPAADGTSPFYYFVESEHNPTTDPLVLWLNGGPGCSSLIGWGLENGPYTVRHGGNFVLNEFRWTTNASILYLESPSGVGFSLNAKLPKNWDDNSTAASNYVALQNWFKKFPQFTNNAFFIAGESYAGHYIPQLAEKILDGPNKVLSSRMKGFMAGNPCTGTIGCNNPDPTLDPYLRYHGFMPLNTSIPYDINDANYDPYDILVPTCPNSQVSRMVQWVHPVTKAMQRRLNDAPSPYGPCADDYITSWFNRADVKRAIHAQANITWSECGGVVYFFNFNGVVPLYERFFKSTNWSLMIYSGTADTVVNFVQTQTIINGMTGLKLVAPYQSWNYPYYYQANTTQLGGFYLRYDRFSWAGVNDAGHMVPQFNPPAAKELFYSFLTLGRPGRL